MDRFDKLMIAARYYLHGKGMWKALEALEMARLLHDGFRKDGVTKEFFHQLQIFHYVRTLEASLLYPEETFIAVFLHDAVEDYPDQVSHLAIRDSFGETVGDAVFALDKSGKTMEAYATACTHDAVASIVKGADRDNNLGSMTGVFSREKQLRYIDETETFYMPMIKAARRLFPFQENAYENIKHVINSKLDLLAVINGE